MSTEHVRMRLRCPSPHQLRARTGVRILQCEENRRHADWRNGVEAKGSDRGRSVNLVLNEKVVG